MSDAPKPSEMSVVEFDLRLHYTGMTSLLMRLRRHVPDEDKEIIDHAIQDAIDLGILPNATQMKSGDWFV